MNTKIAVFSSMLCAGLLLETVPSGYADTLITFQCDMTYQVQAGTFTNGVNLVYARGTFNAYGAGTNAPGFLLTNNPAGINTNLYTGTYDDTVDTNGAQMQYKFYSSVTLPPDSNGYETTAAYNNNRVTLLPAGTGQQSLTLPVQFFGDQAVNVSPSQTITANVWFQVDMSQQIQLGTFNPAVDTVQVNGSLGTGNNFGFGQGATPSGNILTNDPSILRTNQFGLVSSNVYVGYLASPITGSPGQTAEFKYIIQPTAKYESPNKLNGDAQNSGNRFFFLTPDTTNPIVFFSDQPYAPVATNNMTFSVDMTVQNLSGALNGQQVRLSGDFNNWDTTGTMGNLCTNNPSAGNTNIYSVTIAVTNGYGATTQFKFGYVSGNYEANPTHNYPGNPSVIGGNQNREFNMPSASGTNLTLPTVYFNDTSVYAALPAPTETNMVTFSVSMTNAVGTDGHVFDPSSDLVYLNGVDVTTTLGTYTFDAWNAIALAPYQLTNNPVGSEIYSITIPIPAGYPLMLSYQYSINGNQNEASGTNHVRYIRSSGNYNLPLDVFGDMVQEQAFGNLTIGRNSGGTVPISWLGNPGVFLQVTPNVTTWNGADTNFPPGTAGPNPTNYPVGSGTSFFRLINPF